MSKKNTNYTIGNRARDLPARSAVPQRNLRLNICNLLRSDHEHATSYGPEDPGYKFRQFRQGQEIDPSPKASTPVLEPSQPPTGFMSWRTKQSKLRMTGAIPLLPLYDFMAWTETALPSPWITSVLSCCISLRCCLTFRNLTSYI